MAGCTRVRGNPIPWEDQESDENPSSDTCYVCVSALTSLGLSFPFVEIGIYGRAWWRPIWISFLPSFPHNQTLILFGLAVHSTLQRGMAMWPVPAIRCMKKCYVQFLGRLLKGKSIPSVPIPPFLPSSCFRSVIRHDGEAWQPSWTERVSWRWPSGAEEGREEIKMEPGSLMTSELPCAPWTPSIVAIHVILKIVYILHTRILWECSYNNNIMLLYILFCLHIICACLCPFV